MSPSHLLTTMPPSLLHPSHPPTLRLSRARIPRPKPPQISTSSATAVPPTPLTIPQSLACGAFGRLVQILTMYPVDTIKTRIQVSRISTPSSKASPLAPLSAALQQGSLYRGAAFSLLGQIPYGMLTFGLYETFRTHFSKRFPQLPDWAQIILAASAGDAVGSLWLTPSEVVKSKTQAGLYATPVAAARATAKQGSRFFYQGYFAAIARDIPFRAIQLSLYERFRSWYTSHRGGATTQLSPIENLLIGALSGTVTAVFTTPLDVIRTRMMSQASGSQALYKNALDCIVKTVSKEGPTALFKGIAPRCVLLGPSSAVFFLAYEASKSFFRRRQRNSTMLRVSTLRVARRRLVC